jgi:hypothetical protein
MASRDSKFNPETLYNLNLSIFSGKNPIIEAIENIGQKRLQQRRPMQPLLQQRQPMQPLLQQRQPMQPIQQQKFVFNHRYQPAENPTYVTSEGLELSTMADGQWLFKNHQKKWKKLSPNIGLIFITPDGFIALQKASGDCVFIKRSS